MQPRNNNDEVALKGFAISCAKQYEPYSVEWKQCVMTLGQQYSAIMYGAPPPAPFPSSTNCRRDFDGSVTCNHY
jgi:hypothetical protein